MKRFENKVVWITGASSGIGEAVAYQFAKEGAKLILSARRESELLKVKQNTQLPDNQVFILPIDIEKVEEIPVQTQKAIAAFGQIDVLVNNAGISQRGAVNDTDLEVYQRIMNLNFFGVIALTKAILPHFLERKTGHFAVTSSVTGKIGTPMRSGYAASKHALHGFFDSLRSEVFKDNIKVTLICPGYIRTNISYNALNADGSKHDRMDGNQEAGMSPEECARRIVNGIYNQKEEIYMGGKEVLGVYIKRFFPKLLSRIMRNQLPK
jgi:short-subunit dehydrogenase